MKLLFFDDFKLGILTGDTVVDVSQAVGGIRATGPSACEDSRRSQTHLGKRDAAATARQGTRRPNPAAHGQVYQGYGVENRSRRSIRPNRSSPHSFDVARACISPPRRGGDERGIERSEQSERLNGRRPRWN